MADRHPALDGDNRARPYIPDTGPGYMFAGPGGVGPGGVTFPWITPAATPPPDALMFTSRPAATE